MLTLHGLAYSPWTERARWALDHHRIPYRYHEHFMMLDEPYLMWKFGRLGGVTVPALVGQNRSGQTVRLMDSLEIAKFVDREGEGVKLFSDATQRVIREYNDLSEKALDAGRVILMERMSRDKSVRLEAVPRVLPQWIRPYCDPVARLGLWFVRASFGSGHRSADESRGLLIQILSRLRMQLKQSGAAYLLGDFSYADITMAVVLHCVLPARGIMKSMGPLLRQAWGDKSLQHEFRDLVSWRDWLYEKHRFNPARDRR